MGDLLKYQVVGKDGLVSGLAGALATEHLQFQMVAAGEHQAQLAGGLDLPWQVSALPTLPHG